MPAYTQSLKVRLESHLCTEGLDRCKGTFWFKESSTQEEGLVKVIFVKFSRKLSNQNIKIIRAEKSKLNLVRRYLMLRSLVSLLIQFTYRYYFQFIFYFYCRGHFSGRGNKMYGFPVFFQIWSQHIAFQKRTFLKQVFPNGQ